MDDRANNAYASLPERLYVVQDGQVAYQVGLNCNNAHASMFLLVVVLMMLRGGIIFFPRVGWAHLTTGSVTLKTS